MYWCAGMPAMSGSRIFVPWMGLTTFSRHQSKKDCFLWLVSERVGLASNCLELESDCRAAARSGVRHKVLDVEEHPEPVAPDHFAPRTGLAGVLISGQRDDRGKLAPRHAVLCRLPTMFDSHSLGNVPHHAMRLLLVLMLLLLL